MKTFQLTATVQSDQNEAQVAQLAHIALRDSLLGLPDRAKVDFGIVVEEQPTRPSHERDEQCTVDPDTGECTECGVDHSIICGDCGKRGFHTPECCHMDTTFNEHPKIVFPAWLREFGFQDTSYRNDSCARATIELADKVNDLVCWVNYPDALTFDETLYLVELVEHDGTDAVAQLYEGNDVALVIAAIRGILEAPTDAMPKSDAHARV